MSDERSAVEAVARWEAEWLADTSVNTIPWGDRIAWETARMVAQRLDQEHASLPAASEGEPVRWLYEVVGPHDDHARQYCYDHRVDHSIFDDGCSPAKAKSVVVTPLYARPAPSDQEKLVGELVEALDSCERAIAEYYRYFTGGEMRGSYDGKPERQALWNARHNAWPVLARARQIGGAA